MSSLNWSHYNTLEKELSSRPLRLVVVESVLLVLITILSSLGNSCVLLVFYKTPRLCSGANLYVISLACSNILFATVVSPFAIAVSVSGRDVIGYDVGQATGFIFTATVLSSLYTTTLIALNRFFCVVKPLIYRRLFRRPKPTLIMILAVWMLSLVILAVLHVSKVGEFKFYPGRLVYLLTMNNKVIERVSRAVFQLFFAFIPMAICIICCQRVYSIVQHLNASVARARAIARNGSISRREVHITKSLLILVANFIICWIPSTTVFHLAAYKDISRVWQMFSIYIVFVSTAMFPILLNVFNKTFRKRFIVLFRRRNGSMTGIEMFSFEPRTGRKAGVILPLDAINGYSNNRA